MADSMKRLVGLAGNRLASRRWGAPNGIDDRVAEFDGPQCRRARLG